MRASFATVNAFACASFQVSCQFQEIAYPLASKAAIASAGGRSKRADSSIGIANQAASSPRWIFSSRSQATSKCRLVFSMPINE